MSESEEEIVLPSGRGGNEGRRGSDDGSQDERGHSSQEEEGDEIRPYGESEDDDDEEDEEEDEEEVRKVQEGFIVDDDDQSEEADSEPEIRHKRKKKRKIHHDDDDDDEQLDEDDLALVEENTGVRLRNERQLKRLKKGRGNVDAFSSQRDITNIFSDEEENDDDGGRNDRPDRSEQRNDSYDHDNDYLSRNQRSYGRDDMDMEDFIVDEDEDEDDLADVARNRRRRGASLDREVEDRRRRDREDTRRDRNERNRDIDMDLPPGIDADSLHDLKDIFGNGYDYYWAFEAPDTRTSKKPKEKKDDYDVDADDDYEDEQEDIPEPTLQDVFEPNELKERMLTEEDDQIRMTDVPERMQLRFQTISKKALEPADAQTVEEETIWVTNALAKSKASRSQSEAQLQETLRSPVRAILRYLTQDLLEIPFIWQHCKDYFVKQEPGSHEKVYLLTHDDLWKIYDLDYKFRSFDERRRAFKIFWEKIGGVDDYVEEILSKAERLEEISDLMDYVNLHNSQEIHTAQQNARIQEKRDHVKRPMQKSAYDIVKNSKVWRMIKDFGISSREFGTSALAEIRQSYPEDVYMDPEETAGQYVGPGFDTPEKVLKAAKLMLAQQIAADPQVRKRMRKEWERRALVTVRPTEKGNQVIDELHTFYPFKFLTKKPLKNFDNGQFLQIAKAEEDNLVIATFTLERDEKLFDHMADLYISDGVSSFAQVWNEQRLDILRMAFKDYIYPLMERQIRERLRSDAIEYIGIQAQKSLEDKINVAPFKNQRMDRALNRRELYDRIGVIPTPRVVTITWGSGEPKEPMMVVYLNEKGDMPKSGQMRLPSLGTEESRARLREFLGEHKPDIVGVGGFSINTRKLVGIVKEQVMTVRELAEKVQVVVVNDEVARLYRESKRAVKEFPGLPPLMRYCVALARMLQNPLNEYAAMGNDLLSIRHHSLQSFMPADSLMGYLERALVKVTNAVGVDINSAYKNEYQQHLMQYVCGLGPRKVQSLISRIHKENNLYDNDDRDSGPDLLSRADFARRGLLRAIVLRNATSFFRILPPREEILDATRIDIEDYKFAQKMARDAIVDDADADEYEEQEEEYKSKFVVKLLREEQLDELKALDLEDWASALRRDSHGREEKLQTLIMIQQELMNPYGEQRAEYKQPSIAETFMMVTGETEQTLKVNMIVPAQILRTRRTNASCRLESGLDAVIDIKEVSDQPVQSVEDMLTAGDTVNCIVLHIDKNQYKVDLSCKPSRLRQGDAETRKAPEDDFFDFNEMKVELEKAEKKRRNAERSTRVINHPLFKSFNKKEAENYLSNRQRGDVVIRPSSRGNDHLAITWKVDDGIYQHIDVLELNKENGKQFRIKDVNYSDLDELIVMHVESLARKVDELIHHPKYHAGSLENLHDYLTNVTLANPKQSAYGFCIDHDTPGYFSLAYKLNAKYKVDQLSIKVLPEGFKLEGQQTPYTDVQQLINGFKLIQINRASGRHGNPTPSHQRSAASRTPAPRPQVLPVPHAIPMVYPMQHGYGQPLPPGVDMRGAVPGIPVHGGIRR